MAPPTPEFGSLDVAVFGSLNQDLTIRVPRHPGRGETILGTGHSTGAGGKGASQAAAAARLGRSVAMIGAVAAPLGSPKFAVALSGAPATKPATCCLGLKTTSLELGFMDAPGCHLLLSLDLLLGTTTDSSGKALQSLPIPPVPSFAGLILYAEWYVVDPAINKAGIGTSGGLAITILK